MQRSSEQDAGMATKTGLQGGEGEEMSLNNIKSPPSSETGSKLLHAKTNIQIDLPAIIKFYSTQPLHFRDHTTALGLEGGKKNNAELCLCQTFKPSLKRTYS